MANEQIVAPQRPPLSFVPWIMAAAMIVFLWVTNHGYGFHRDELATLDDARHLDWGFVAYPPLTPFFAWVSLHLFGTSLAGFRLFASCAAALVLPIAAAIAGEFGGNRTAQMLTAAATIPFGLATGSLMQYVAFDYLWWVLTFYCFVRLVSSNDPRWWLAIGASIGLGMLTKYSMLFCVAGIGVAFIFARRWPDLRSRWLWLGVLISLLLFLPNLFWQIRNDFVSLDFLRHIHERDIRIGRTKDFLPDQVEITLCALPLAVAGLWFFCVSKFGRKWRPLACLYFVPLLLFVIAQGRGYYLAPAYPLLFAGGVVWLGLITGEAPRWRGIVWSVATIAIVLNIAIVATYVMPLAPVGSAWFQRALKANDDLAEEFGWPELVETLAKVSDSLGEEERASAAIFAANYGEAGSINLYGKAHRLPRLISGVNSFWARGCGDPPPKILILVGFSKEFAENHFDSHELAAHVTNHQNVVNEETKDHPDVFICRGLKEPWPAFWKKIRHYG